MLLGIASGDWIPPNKSKDGLEHWGGSGWARLGQYLPHLDISVAVGILVWNRNHFTIVDHTGAEYHPDVILMQRLMHKGIAENIVGAQAYGQKIINDVDDWYWGLAPTNYAFHINHPKRNPDENIDHYKATLAKSDLLLVSTPYLASRLSGFVNTPIELLKNTVDLERFIVKEHTDTTTPQVGWVGSTLHRSGDLETMKGIIGPMVREGLITMYHGGHISSAPSLASKVGLKDYEVTTKPICTSDVYPELLTMDIGIIPLTMLPFNRAKSDIKGLEYAASGIPFIAQNIDAYIELQQELGIGRLAKNPSKWIRHIEDLRNPKVRAEEGALVRESVSARDIKIGAKHLADVLNNL